MTVKDSQGSKEHHQQAGSMSIDEAIQDPLEAHSIEVSRCSQTGRLLLRFVCRLSQRQVTIPILCTPPNAAKLAAQIQSSLGC